MKHLLKPGSMPRAKVGDFENALALLAAMADVKVTKKSLTEHKDATATYDKARDGAEAAERNAAKRDSEAREAEADAIRARQILADETATAHAELGKREKAVAERERQGVRRRHRSPREKKYM